MNKYIARNIFVEVKDNIKKICGCPQNYRSKICATSGIAILIPVTFCLQTAAIISDQWAYKNEGSCYVIVFNNTSNNTCHTFGCYFTEYTESRLCVLEIASVVMIGLLMIVGCGVCCRTCCHNITLESCTVCYVCIMSLLSLVPGILSVCCSIATVRFVSDHSDFTYGFPFYAYTLTGSATTVISLASVCGYTCVKSCELRQDYETQIGSDDGDSETAPILDSTNYQNEEN